MAGQSRAAKTLDSSATTSSAFTPRTMPGLAKSAKSLPRAFRFRGPQQRRRQLGSGAGACEAARSFLELGECRLLLLEILLQERHGLGLAEGTGHRDQARVRGNLVVLGAGAGSGQEHVTDLGRRLLLGHELVVLLRDALDSRALLGLGLLTDAPEDLLEVGSVLLRLLEMCLEALLQPGVAGFRGELRQGLDEGLLREQEIPQLMQEQLARVIHLGRHDRALLLIGVDSSQAVPAAAQPETSESRSASDQA